MASGGSSSSWLGVSRETCSSASREGLAGPNEGPTGATGPPEVGAEVPAGAAETGTGEETAGGPERGAGKRGSSGPCCGGCGDGVP